VYSTTYAYFQTRVFSHVKKDFGVHSRKFLYARVAQGAGPSRHSVETLYKMIYQAFMNYFMRHTSLERAIKHHLRIRTLNLPQPGCDSVDCF
jgi:hypothetical protein